MIMPTSVMNGLGYDSFGNQPKLLHPTHAELIEKGEIHRVGNDAVCEKCKCVYRLHPQVQGALWLNLACDGRLLKL